MRLSKVSLSFSARPPETMILALVSSGRSLLAISELTKVEIPASPAPETFSDLGRATFGRGLFEGGAAHGDDQLGIGRFDRGNGVAGVDRAGEGLGAFNRQDFGNLHHIEVCRDARGDVLALRGGRRQERVVVAHQVSRERGDVFGKAVGVGRIVRHVDLAHASDPGSRFGDRTAIVARDQQVHFAKLRCSGDDREGRVIHSGVVMFDENQSLHVCRSLFLGTRRAYAMPSALTFSTSAATSATFSPA